MALFRGIRFFKLLKGLNTERGIQPCFFVLKKSDLFLGTAAEIGNGCGNFYLFKSLIIRAEQVYFAPSEHYRQVRSILAVLFRIETFLTCDG